MIAELNALSTEAKLNLLKMFSAEDAFEVVNTDDRIVLERLVEVLKYHCSSDLTKDFSLGLRKQMLQVCSDLDILWDKPSTDLLTDLALANMLVSSVVQEAGRMDLENDLFFKTKAPKEKALAKKAAETQSPEALALVAGAWFMSEDRAGRARKSRVVQNTVKLCAFMVQA